MKTIGFAISHKENENRRALIPDDIERICHPEYIYIEEGYGDVLGYGDEDYLRHGIGGICSREELLKKDVICDPKIGDAEYLEQLDSQTIFGWIHAVQNRDITDKLIQSRLTVYAWEDMYEDGRHSFWRNNEIAGEAAVFHAYMCHGIFPYNTKAAISLTIFASLILFLYFLGNEALCMLRREFTILLFCILNEALSV